MIPMNSLVGEARFCRFPMLFDNLKKRCVEDEKMVLKYDSELYPLTTFSPPKVSSIVDKNIPCSSCASVDFFLIVYLLTK